MGNSLPPFEPDFATPADWATMYRAAGLQVVPGYMPGEGNGSWKRPLLSSWTAHQNDLMADDAFARLYGEGGKHIARQNMGLITGRCSGNAFIIDLDVHKNPAALAWWNAILEVENNGIEFDTVEQRTGGGGIQKLFLAPPGFVVPTIKTAIGVDIRGQGGFAVLPPSLHESRAHYGWLPGRAPWEIEIEVAPAWLLEAITDLAEAHGGGPAYSAITMGTNGPVNPGISGPHIPSGEQILNEFGIAVDGRESLMRDVVWHAVLELYRESPIKPPQAAWREACARAYLRYEQAAETRLTGTARTEGLEREGRGTTLFFRKFVRLMRVWGSPKMVAEAAKPPPVKEKAFGSDFHEDFAPINPATGQVFPSLLLTAQEFVAGFTPPSYLIDGIVQCGYLYSLTARTHHGKTAVTMYIAQCVARSEPMHGCRVRGGTVLLLAGENPDDIRARFLVLAEAYGFDATTLRMRFIAGVVDLVARMPQIRAEAADIPDLVLVIVDTAAAYFPGDETNSNSQQGAYARVLRELTVLPGKPAVIVNCHPIKNAARENLLPMGGSAFVNEVDGNLTLWANNERQASLHWGAKFRGPEFDPLSFELITATSPVVKDAEGRLMPSVVARPISDATLEAGEQVQESDEDKVMRLIHTNPKASFATLAEKAGFSFNGRPQKQRIQRIVERLRDDRLVTKHRGGKYRLTKKGAKEIGVDKEGDDDE